MRSIQTKKVGLGSSSALEIHSPWFFWHFLSQKRSSSDTQYFKVRKRRCLLVVKFCAFSKSGKYKLKKLGWALPSALKIHSPWFFGIFFKVRKKKQFRHPIMFLKFFLLHLEFTHLDFLAYFQSQKKKQFRHQIIFFMFLKFTHLIF